LECFIAPGDSVIMQPIRAGKRRIFIFSQAFGFLMRFGSRSFIAESLLRVVPQELPNNKVFKHIAVATQIFITR
jgi:hypothetical protein